MHGDGTLSQCTMHEFGREGLLELVPTLKRDRVSSVVCPEARNAPASGPSPERRRGRFAQCPLHAWVARFSSWPRGTVLCPRGDRSCGARSGDRVSRCIHVGCDNRPDRGLPPHVELPIVSVVSYPEEEPSAAWRLHWRLGHRWPGELRLTLQMARSGLGVVSAKEESLWPPGRLPASSPKRNPPVGPISSSARQQQACSLSEDLKLNSGAAHRLGLVERGAGCVFSVSRSKRLEVEPEPVGGSEVAHQPQDRVSRDPALAVHDLGDPTRRDVDGPPRAGFATSPEAPGSPSQGPRRGGPLQCQPLSSRRRSRNLAPVALPGCLSRGADEQSDGRP